MNPKSITEIAAALSLSEKALNDRRRKIRMANPKDVEGQLLAWLRAAYEEHRDKVNRLAKGSGYTEFWSGSMGASHRHQLGNLHEEPESVGHDEVANYRESRQAAARFEVEKAERTGELLGAIQQLKGAVYAMDPELKKRVSRELWTLKGRIDTLERKLKREKAA